MALPVSEFLSAFVIGVILIMGAKLIFIDKILEPEKFVVFLAGVLSLTTPLKSFARANTFIQQSKAVFQRISQILSLPKEDKGGKIEFGRFKEKIEFKNVWFSYNGNKWALKNVSFVIKKGEKVALIGHSGAGKTTIIDLLLGFYKPQKGGIFVDGKNLFDYNLHSWRKKISIMPQEPFLFSGTLKENILYVSDVSDKELKDVLKKVGLNKPVDIEVGENGVMLSVGEKQRVTLARAILKKPEILILDEPTSSVDIETENKINKLIEEIAENKTLIIIAHRLNTIKKVDKVIVLENGEIKKIAKPFEILQEKGVGKWEK
ncbi:hypothetical protein DRN73_09160 [Candidatus Pacearchaeota archaeon]|nr:MAG: hypothetical protein DRN73_09160 [Candidatus Pacearchaeota archaeon]